MILKSSHPHAAICWYLLTFSSKATAFIKKSLSYIKVGRKRIISTEKMSLFVGRQTWLRAWLKDFFCAHTFLCQLLYFGKMTARTGSSLHATQNSTNQVQKIVRFGPLSAVRKWWILLEILYTFHQHKISKFTIVVPKNHTRLLL